MKKVIENVWHFRTKILTSSGCVGGLGIHDQINDTLAVFSSSFHALFTGNSKV